MPALTVASPRPAPRSMLAVNAKALRRCRVVLCHLLCLGVLPAIRAADTVQDFALSPTNAPRFRLDTFGSPPGPAVQDGGWDGKFLRLASQVNSQLNVVSFPRTFAASPASLIIGFDFRIDNGPAGADGFGIAFLNSTFFGDDLSLSAPVITEEPDLSGSFGVGFDTWNNGDGGPDTPVSPVTDTLPNSFSLHWNQALLTTLPLPGGVTFESPSPGTVYKATIKIEYLPANLGRATINVVQRFGGAPLLDNFQLTVPGLTPYNGRLAIGARTGGLSANHDLDNIYLEKETQAGSGVFERVLAENFEQPNGVGEPEVAGGTPFSVLTGTAPPGPKLRIDPGAPAPPGTTAGFLRLAHEQLSQSGLVAFDRTSTEPGDIAARFLFRGTDSGALGRADGGAFLLIDSARYGDTGASSVPPLLWEDANGPGIFAVGFDTFDNGILDEGVQSPESLIANHVSVHLNGVRLAVQNLDRAQLDLASGVFHAVAIDLVRGPAGSTLSVTLRDGGDGSLHKPFVDLPIPDLQFQGLPRVALGARTGGFADDYDFDDLNVSFYDPESNAWSPTGDAGEGRTSHTATLLADGRVLFAAGRNATGVVRSAEIYDPATGTWSATGSLATRRFAHTGTLLPGGKVLVVGGFGINSVEIYDPESGSWSTAFILSEARDFHTATLLANGRVLVAGGRKDGGPALRSADLYDPESGTWSPTGSLGTGRVAHTATLLANGRVLAVGGCDTGQCTASLASAEVYDPASGQWSETGSLNESRDVHAAVLLPDGKVLVAGGVRRAGGHVATAEIYDPAAGTWSLTGKLLDPRRGPTLTLLPDGKVLAAAGDEPGGYLRTTELYDPASGRWSPAGRLAEARGSHTATLLASGDVLVAGGNQLANVYPRTAELFRSGRASWTTTGGLGGKRRGHTATLLPNGKVLAAGGNDALNSYVRTAELYDPASGTWSATGSLGTARADHTATLLPDGTVLAAGGANLNTLSAVVELYDPSSGRWSNTGSLNAGRIFHAATLLANGKLLVAGGISSSTGLTGSTEVYDPASRRWSTTGSLRTARHWHTATLLADGRVLVAAGGISAGPSSILTSAELYNPASGTWAATGSLATPRQLHSAILLASGKVLVAGGGNDTGIIESAEVYDPATGAWSPIADLKGAREIHAVERLPGGKVLAAGGLNQFGLASDAAELFDPASGMWSALPDLVTARSSHTATLLASGKVLVAGGGEGNSSLNAAELFDAGLGFDPAWRPVISSAEPSPFVLGSRLVLTGVGFRGISEASGGNGSQNSSTGVPLVEIRSLATRVSRFLPPDPDAGWSDTAFTSQAVSGFPLGHALLTVFANGIPSESLVVQVLGPAAATTTTAEDASALFSAANQNVTLRATVTSTSPVQGGTVTFTVKSGATVIGSPATSLAVAGGAASARFVLPGGTAAGTYRVEAAYSGSADFLASADGTHRLAVRPFDSAAVLPWIAADVAASGAPGGARPAPGCAGLEVLGAVGSLGGAADSFHFVRQQTAGDFTLTGHVVQWSGGLTGARFGLMARAGLSPAAPHFSLVLAGGRLRTLARQAAGAVTEDFEGPAYPQAPDQPDVWLRLERSGDDFIASFSSDGSTFVELERAQPELGSDVAVGIAATDIEGPDGRAFSHGRICALVLEPGGLVPGGRFSRGDANQSGGRDLSDGVFVLNYLFTGGLPPRCLKSADNNDSGRVDLSDPVYLFSFLFLGGPPPLPPFPECGTDPTEDAVSCVSYSLCP